ncbi:unnamed protein product [marine sediment metagenome]|uniref:Uncharacterized protein n=1 Tax=marine sediment metagenome TaxID=412755 RepID=X1BCJ3_9ZZZZ
METNVISIGSAFFNLNIKNKIDIIAVRIFMLIFYYYIHVIDPSRSWGDVELNFIPLYVYPPLSMLLLEIFIVLSFGSLEVFTFWAFFIKL